MKPPLWCSRKARDGRNGLVGPVIYGRDMEVQRQRQLLLYRKNQLKVSIFAIGCESVLLPMVMEPRF
jgi:hypothetical protein